MTGFPKSSDVPDVPTAVVFPGQGSQRVGMLSAYNPSHYKAFFKKASDILGYDIGNIIEQGPEEKLNQTAITQPALLTASVFLWETHKILFEKRPPVVLAGHSLGEYSALVCANALSFEEAVYLTAERGRLMQAAVPENQGAMAAVIGLEEKTVHDICLAITAQKTSPEKGVFCANFNAPGQIVIAGFAASVDEASVALKKAGAKLIKKLPISIPSHCLLMTSAAEAFKTCLDQCEIKPPCIPVLQNAGVKAYDTPQAIKQALVNQLFSPVDWIKTIQTLRDDYHISHILECGPGRVLSGLNKRICDTLTVSHFN